VQLQKESTPSLRVNGHPFAPSGEGQIAAFGNFPSPPISQGGSRWGGGRHFPSTAWAAWFRAQPHMWEDCNMSMPSPTPHSFPSSDPAFISGPRCHIRKLAGEGRSVMCLLLLSQHAVCQSGWGTSWTDGLEASHLISGPIDSSIKWCRLCLLNTHHVGH
jgi:hypothetical protein